MSYELPTKTTPPVHGLAGKKIIVYGAPKVGKSTLAAQFPRALFLSTAGGVREIECASVPVRSWADFKGYMKSVRGDGESAHPLYDWIVMDHFGDLKDMLVEDFCERNGLAHESDMDKGQKGLIGGSAKGYQMLNREWRNVVATLAAMPQGMVWITHEVTREIVVMKGRIETKQDKSFPLIAGSDAYAAVTAHADMILHCDRVTPRLKDGALAPDQRVLQTADSDRFYAGCRMGMRPDGMAARMPDEIPMGYEHLVHAYETAVTVPADKNKEQQ